MVVFIYWGKTGTGKTRSVYDQAKELGESVFSLVQNDSGTPWFDGYAGEEVLLIDDFYGWCKVSFLLKLLDRYPLNVQVKGSMIPFISKKIIFTSNIHPEYWFNWKNDEIKNAFFRRITEIKEF